MYCTCVKRMASNTVLALTAVEKKASAALLTVAASESHTGLHVGVKSLREILKQEAN